MLKRTISIICAVGMLASCATGFVSAGEGKKLSEKQEKDLINRLYNRDIENRKARE